jgi:hypothetical protein
LPPALVEALDKIGGQIDVEVFDPLLCAASVEELAETFGRVFPKFRDYYLSTLLIMWGVLQEDAKRFSLLTIGSFRASEDLIRVHGPQWIGRDAGLEALRGLATIIRVAKAASRVLEEGRPTELRVEESRAASWADSIVAYALAISVVVASLNRLASGRPSAVTEGNLATLAHWSNDYAAQAYHLTKVIGLLNPKRPGGPIGASENEDLVLAEAGLDSYAEMLREDDQS